MAEVSVHVPRPLSLFFLAFGLVFGYVWMSAALSSGFWPFILLGGLFMLVFVGIAGYQLVTGKSPITYRVEKNQKNH